MSRRKNSVDSFDSRICEDEDIVYRTTPACRACGEVDRLTRLHPMHGIK
jgi:hypothetical protein